MNNKTKSYPHYYIPDSVSKEEALKRTSHMAIGAHPDDIEFFAFHGINECFDDDNKWFMGITLCDGAGSPRVGKYAKYSDQEMIEIRKKEQDRAAQIGKYSIQWQFQNSSTEVKQSDFDLTNLRTLIEETRPEVIYTHNLADRHNTHVAVALRVIEALQSLKDSSFLKAVYGCEIWRDLDWLPVSRKIKLDVGENEDLARDLCQVYESQIEGGKNYAEAVIARRKANATFSDSHMVDQTKGLTFAIDYLPLIKERKSPIEFLNDILNEFQDDILEPLKK